MDLLATAVVLIDRDQVLRQSVYLPTRGRPVEVLQHGLDRIAQRFGRSAIQFRSHRR